ncbi:MAG: hypothetical protein PHU44_10575 [Syntrophales bacterium]|nr:hypothetical protein [Syntrophales bacterium]MDD5642637.1 hypothetical protein [Syntrophales bacterium]
MNLKKRGSALKVCRTCRYWSDKHKGTCTRLQRGAGQFWMCDEWLEITANAGVPQENDEPEGAPSP